MKSKFVKAGLLLMMFVIMTALSACGGGASISETTLDNEGTNTEANCGIREIVFAIQDGWKVVNSEEDHSVDIAKDGSKHSIFIYTTDQEDLSNSEGDISKMTIDEFFDKYCKVSEKAVKETEMEASTTTICGSEAYYCKRKADNGFISADICWLYNDVIYRMTLNNYENYDENGPKPDAVAYTDEDIAAFEYLIASIKSGDGNALQKEAFKIDSVAGLSFDAPEGYEVNLSAIDWVEFANPDNNTVLQIMTTNADTLDNHTKGDGSKYASVEDLYKDMIWDDMTDVSVDGITAKKSVYDEDGKIVNAELKLFYDDTYYEIAMMCDDTWTEDGSLNPDSKGLSESDVAAFDAFCKSLKKK